MYCTIVYYTNVLESLISCDREYPLTEITLAQYH